MKIVWILQRLIGKGSKGYGIVVALALFLCMSTSQLNATPVYFNSLGASLYPWVTLTDANETQQQEWLEYLLTHNITEPQFTEDFETGFLHNQSLNGVPLDGGLTISSTNQGSPKIEDRYQNLLNPFKPIDSGVGWSNPIGNFAAVYFDTKGTLELDFANPINYLAFYDIDHPALTITLTYANSSLGQDTFILDQTNPLGFGDTAEFFGLYSDALISKVSFGQVAELADWDGIAGIDNVAWGVANMVPIPSAFLLLGSGLLGIIGIRRKILG